MLRYMLDTNIVIYVGKKRPPEILEIFNRHAGQMCISSMTLAELFHGVEKSSQKSRAMKTLEEFVAQVEILDYDLQAAAHYGDIRANLERKGTPIGVNDIHITAHARSRGLVLVTNNKKEFLRVEGLRIENWVNNSA